MWAAAFTEDLLLFARVSLSLVHNSGSLVANVPLEQTSGRAMVWEEKLLKKPTSLAVSTLRSISITRQKSLLRYLQIQERPCAPPYSWLMLPCPSPVMPTGGSSPWIPTGLKITVFAKRGNGTLMRMKSKVLGHIADSEISPWPSYFANCWSSTSPS